VVNWSKRVAKERLDVELVARGLIASRSTARAMILAGDVLVNSIPARHAGDQVAPADLLELKNPPRFVSRGGEKLDHALKAFDIDVDRRVCADLGASTGGFTDCLLQRGARRVYAVDVGYGQLDARLRGDPRVVVMERVNARHLDGLPEPIDIVAIDVSFISLSLILPVAARLLGDNGICIPLIKPQFEAGRAEVGKGGVVKDRAVHCRVLDRVAGFACDAGFELRSLARSPLRGPAGNIEFLAHLIKAAPYAADDQVASLIESVVGS
jgi:23S rRNA (cytidine1920-2'-O)/16S rRNA (cytidine1409-2'-O)-methyltransferase